MKFFLIIICAYLIFFCAGCAIVSNKPQEDVYYITHLSGIDPVFSV